jgi:hypothetical protein
MAVVYSLRSACRYWIGAMISDAFAFSDLWTSAIAFAYAKQREFFTLAGAPREAAASPAAR